MLSCFASPLWACVDVSVFFDENYRQNETDLKHLLHNFRVGQLSPRSQHFVKHFLTCPLDCNPLDVVRLYSHRDSISPANDECLALLPGEPYRYCSKDFGKTDTLKNCYLPKNLVVKLKARVVLLKNLNPKLVNGHL